MWGRLHIKTTKISPFFCYIPVFQPFKTMKRRNASDDEERGHKKLREQAVCELSSSQESSITVRKGNFATRY